MAGLTVFKQPYVSDIERGLENGRREGDLRHALLRIARDRLLDRRIARWEKQRQERIRRHVNRHQILQTHLEDRITDYLDNGEGEKADALGELLPEDDYRLLLDKFFGEVWPTQKETPPN